MNKIFGTTLILVFVVALAAGLIISNLNQSKDDFEPDEFEFETADELGTVNNEFDNLDVDMNVLSRDFEYKDLLENEKYNSRMLTEELKIVKEEVKKLELAAKNDSSDKEIDSLMRELQDKDNDIELAKKELASLKEKYALLFEDKSRIEKVMLEAKTSYSNVEESIEQEKRKMRALRARMLDKEEESLELTRRVKRLSKLNDELEEEIEQIRAREGQIISSNSAMKEELDRLSKEADDKSKLIVQLQAKIENPKDANAKEVAFLKKELQKKQDKLKRVGGLYDKLKGQLKEMSKIVSAREKNIWDRDRQMEVMKDEISYLKLEIANLEGSLKYSKDSQKAIYNKLSELSGINVTLQESLGEVSGFLVRQIDGYPVPDKSGVSIADDSDESDVVDGVDSQSNRAVALKKQIEVILHEP